MCKCTHNAVREWTLTRSNLVESNHHVESNVPIANTATKLLACELVQTSQGCTEQRPHLAIIGTLHALLLPPPHPKSRYFYQFNMSPV
jgi:hypothetical protein